MKTGVVIDTNAPMFVMLKMNRQSLWPEVKSGRRGVDDTVRINCVG